MATTRALRVFALVGGAAAGLFLFLAGDYALGPRLLPHPDAEVEWVPAAERPYLQGAEGWYELKRGFRGRDYWGNRIYPVHTDEFGFRAAEGRAAKPGPAAVIVLGDSFTYGLNGPWDETFVGMLDLALPVRIANAGVPSYSPTPYLHRYRQALADGALQSPHTVVVALDISDVHDEAGVWIDGDPPKNLRAVNADRGLVVTQQKAAAATSRGQLRDRLRLTGAIYRALRYSLLAIPNPAVFDQMKSSFTWQDWETLDATPAALTGFSPLGVRGGLDRIAGKLAELTALAHANRSTLFVLLYPWPAQLRHPDKFSWSDFVAQACERAACDGVIDTIPIFRERAHNDARWYNALYVKGDVHFNTEGNRLIFEALKRGLPLPAAP
ncbi:MAG: hypothetical protein AB7P34_22280 [Vicinamibacterales bacterium]